MSFFFFQAEDGIRDVAVTGVQTCALPISDPNRIRAVVRTVAIRIGDLVEVTLDGPANGCTICMEAFLGSVMTPTFGLAERSEERRVGKSVDLGGRRIIKKKKKRRARCDVC